MGGMGGEGNGSGTKGTIQVLGAAVPPPVATWRLQTQESGQQASRPQQKRHRAEEDGMELDAGAGDDDRRERSLTEHIKILTKATLQKAQALRGMMGAMCATFLMV